MSEKDEKLSAAGYACPQRRGMMEMPPLPERHGELPELVLPEVHGMGGNTMVLKAQSVYTAAQMHAHGELCARMAREQAAKVCDAQYERDRAKQIDGEQSDDYSTGYHDATGDCAAAIRKG